MRDVERYERAFLSLSAVLLVLFLGALAYAAVELGAKLPTREGEIDPTQVRATAPFDAPGVRQVGPNRYEVVMLGQIWSFVPGEVRIPAGSEVTFIATSADVIHGLEIEGTRLNAMLLPGQVTKLRYSFEKPGEHLIICHEYCGVGHHLMYGKVIVE